jgi:hypothetical protein
MKPVCVKCQRFFRIKKTGFYFVEAMPTVNGATPGTSAPELWKPYKLWASDKWECQGCGAIILSGFGIAPICVNHEDDFAAKVKSFGGGQLQVNDC